MTEIDKIIGANIRRARKARGMTIRELTHLICLSAHSDCATTESTIGAWERGQRSISAHSLVCVANSLGCSISSLYDENIDRESRMHVEGSSLPADLQQIVNYAFVGWEGDIHALIRFMGLYMSLSKEFRQDIAGMGLTMYDQALLAGQVQDVPYEQDIRYIERQWKSLVRGDA